MAMGYGHVGWNRIAFSSFNNKIGTWYAGSQIVNRNECIVVFHTNTLESQVNIRLRRIVKIL